MNLLRLALAFLLLLALPVRGATLHIAAAADLAHCLPPLNQAFAVRHPEADLKVATGSSGNFFAQIRQGAPFEVFLSADQRYPQALVQAGLASADSLRPYAVGQLALWSSSPAIQVSQGLRVLTSSKVRRIAIANPEHAPYGRAARAALERAGLWDALQPKLVLGENIAQAAQFVASSNADAGLVAGSLLQAPALAGRGQAWLLPADSFPRLEQAAVLTRRGAASPLAQAYLDFLGAPEARQIFRRCGFLLPDARP